MANKEHLAILKEGVDTWNAWRHTNPEIKPDLIAAPLLGERLVNVNFSSAELQEADLSWADLNSASFFDAKLYNANFSNAYLSGAKLRRAHAARANLEAADLSNANLEHADLSEARLATTNLTGANLKFANFSTADGPKAILCISLAESATFQFANLDHADLSFARLKAADFRHANLAGANFEEAHLIGTDFHQARLNGTDFKRALMTSTALSDLDLSTAIGLDSVQHYGPCSIGIDTLFRSKSKIPELFLRGCGVPEHFITYARALVANPIDFYSCFISYSSIDTSFADRLHADLQKKGIRCWYAPEDLKIGDKFRTSIEESIRVYDKVLIVLSENSIKSAWVQDEVEAALERERQHSGSLVLFPIQIDNGVMETRQAWAASLRRQRHIGDFTHWKDHVSYQKALARLLRDLRGEKTKATPTAK